MAEFTVSLPPPSPFISKQLVLSMSAYWNREHLLISSRLLTISCLFHIFILMHVEFCGKPFGKHQCGGMSKKWEDYIRINLREVIVRNGGR
jgi:hypothetical protein